MLASILVAPLLLPASAAAQTGDDQAAISPSAELRVIVQEDTAPGERPVFEVIDTDLVGFLALAVDPANDRVMLDGVARLTWEPADPDYPLQSEHHGAGLTTAWETTRGDSDVVIAVLDSGVTPHPELGDRLLAGASFVGGDPSVDESGHGTSVAVAAAGGANGLGGVGTCPACSILPVQVARPDGLVPWSAAAEGLIWAVEHGADIVNMSFTAPAVSGLLADAVGYARQQGVLLVAAAGNEGDEELAYPAALDGVLAVAGHDGTGARFSWSSHGDWVELAAPGCVHTLTGDDFATACGTSFASPWTAGVVGLLLAADRPELTPEEVMSILAATAEPNDWTRHGRVVADEAPRPPTDPPPSPPLFFDVAPGSFYAPAVGWMVAEGITVGTTATTFSPEAAVSRGEVAALLWRWAGLPVVGDRPGPFVDVAPGSFYAPAVGWMVAEGITVGTTATTFSPDAAVSRAEIATMIWRLAAPSGVMS